MITATPAARQRGFGLMELVVALAILGILVAVAVPFYRDYTTKASVTKAYAMAEEARTKVEVDLIDGRCDAVKLKAPLSWVCAGPQTANAPVTPVGAIIPKLTIAGQGEKNVLALQRLSDGNWICMNAAKVGASDALDEKYLPPACHGAGTALAAVKAAAPAAPACPADQESITLPTGPACAVKCATGTVRDPANPPSCKPVVCGPNEEKHYNTGRCVTIPPKPTCLAGEDAFRVYDNDNNPIWGCYNACPAGTMPGKALKCVPDPNAKPLAPVAPAAAKTAATPTPAVVTPKPAAVAPTAAAPAAKPAAPVAPPAVAASVKCRTCTAGLEDLCEQVHEEITCSAPNNWCITFVDNQADGTKKVSRGCGNFERVRTEWYQGTSDDDKCRERINVEQKLDFTCTFGCGKDNCNDNLRPAEDTLYQPT